MNVHLYKIECLTNLHVGSGDINYNVVDNEVEKDINGYAMIHSSGLKGALREQAEKPLLKRYEKLKAALPQNEKTQNVKREDDPLYIECMQPVVNIFGQEAGSKEIKKGTYKFLDANIICRPLRVYGSPFMASIPVFSIDSIDSFLRKISNFGIKELKGKINGGEVAVDISPYSDGLDKSLFDFDREIECADGTKKVEKYEFITSDLRLSVPTDIPLSGTPADPAESLLPPTKPQFQTEYPVFP